MDDGKIIVSNNIGPNGEPADRIYGNPSGQLRLVNADYTEYKGNIKKKQLIKKGTDGNNFKSHCYVTDDNRWFDRGGMPILPPDDVVVEDKEEDENNTTE
jgi:hypothetical protein